MHDRNVLIFALNGFLFLIQYLFCYTRWNLIFLHHYNEYVYALAHSFTSVSTYFRRNMFKPYMHVVLSLHSTCIQDVADAPFIEKIKGSTAKLQYIYITITDNIAWYVIKVKTAGSFKPVTMSGESNNRRKLDSLCQVLQIVRDRSNTRIIPRFSCLLWRERNNNI